MLWPLPRIYDRLLRPTERACLSAWRADLLTHAYGRVLEVGAGTGANLPYFPQAVRELVLVEPERILRGRLRRRLPAQPLWRVRVERRPLERLRFPSEHFDTVVSTLVLCSLPQPAHALTQMLRLLRPGGKLLFIEHVAACDRPRRLRWQQLLEPLWKRVFGNCHLTRDTATLIEAAGFRFDSLTRTSMRGAFPLVRPSIRGVARKPHLTSQAPGLTAAEDTRR